MVANPVVFAENFHMTTQEFQILFEKLELDLQPKSANRKDEITPMHKLAAVLE